MVGGGKDREEMREILFRAKRLDNGEWVEGFLFETEENSYIAYNKQFDDDLFLSPQNIFIPIDKATICQYTGLTDKNGNKIWENDVIGYWDTYSTENGLAEADCIGKVFWDDETLSFQVTERLSAESYEVMDECSVIGNIFDNADLLKGE